MRAHQVGPYSGTVSPPEFLAAFSGDWITAWFDIDNDASLLHVDAGLEEWVPETLVVLLPGTHELVGDSFFRLRG